MQVALGVNPRPDVSATAYDVTLPGESRVVRVDYQPGDSHRPTIATCECSTVRLAIGQPWACAHLNAVKRFRHEAEG